MALGAHSIYVLALASIFLIPNRHEQYTGLFSSTELSQPFHVLCEGHLDSVYP